MNSQLHWEAVNMMALLSPLMLLAFIMMVSALFGRANPAEQERKRLQDEQRFWFRTDLNTVLPRYLPPHQ